MSHVSTFAGNRITAFVFSLLTSRTKGRRRNLIDQWPGHGKGGSQSSSQVRKELRKDHANGCPFRRLRSQSAAAHAFPQTAGELLAPLVHCDDSGFLFQHDLSIRKQEYERLCYREKQILSKYKSTVATTTTKSISSLKEVSSRLRVSRK